MKKNKKLNKKDTSWENVSGWYDDLLEKGKDTYQAEVILPNLIRLVDPKKGEKILDLACGQGYFARVFAKSGMKVTGLDVSKSLIEQAKKHGGEIEYVVGSADDLGIFENESFYKVTIILALQNIKNLSAVFSECSRVLQTKGKLFVVLNHPAFRLPKASAWGFDEERGVQYRRIDAYMSEKELEIDMTPGGEKKKIFTTSFHRPLQVYVKLLGKNQLFISKMEEWISHKESQKGPRKVAEDRARKEIPLFMCVEATKVSQSLFEVSRRNKMSKF